MNKEELKKWISEHKIAYSGVDEYDYECGNLYEYIIYDVDGKLYRMDFCNGYPCEKWNNDKGYIRGVYEPIEVVKKVEMVKHTTFEPI